MAAIKKGNLTDPEKTKERENKRRSIADIQTDADIITNADPLKLERPHKISFTITTADLLKFKAYCITNKINQQDKAYLVFKNWIDTESINM